MVSIVSAIFMLVMNDLWYQGIPMLFHGISVSRVLVVYRFPKELCDLLEKVLLVWFYGFDYFGYFWDRDRRVLDFMIFGGSTTLSWCIGF